MSQSPERIDTNTIAAAPAISICIPAWNDDAAPLLKSLRGLDRIAACEVLIYDDGSANPEMTASILEHLNNIDAPAKLITATQNQGRAHARNRLITHARADWLLLLDADMLPDTPAFIANYLNMLTAHPAPALIAGGFSLQHVTPTRKQALHAAQSARSECLTAQTRQTEPGRYVFTSNILVHRQVLETVRFDDSYSGWGWEDVDWGLRVAKEVPVRHIENTATHLGLDDDAGLMRKYETSGANFARLVASHPEAVKSMTLYRAAHKLKSLPGRSAIRALSRLLAKSSALPITLRLAGLKLFRAAIYAEDLT